MYWPAVAIEGTTGDVDEKIAWGECSIDRGRNPVSTGEMKALLEFRRNASQEFRSSGEKYPSSSRDLLFPLLLFVPLFIFGRRPYRVVSRSLREGRCDRDRARRRWSAT